MKIPAHESRLHCPTPEPRHQPESSANINISGSNSETNNSKSPKPRTHRQSTLQTSLLTQMPSRKKNKDAYFAEWDAWANAASGVTWVNRMEAVGKMKAWLDAHRPNAILNLHRLGLASLPENLPDSLQHLDISYNQLTSLPKNLPDSLQRLDAYNNQLTCLPENLPNSLQNLNIHHNQLTSLPENLPGSLQGIQSNNNRLTSLPENLPGSLQGLHVDHNQLTSLPENLPGSLQSLHADHNQLTSLPWNLPDSLQSLFVSHNQITSLPENLPDSLQSLDVSLNQLTSLPENITVRLAPDCLVDLDDNPIPERVRNHLHEVVNAAGYNGPVFSFSMAATSCNAPARPLKNAVSEWYGESERDSIKAKWSAFANEEGAGAFSQFLDRLRATVNSGNPEFKQSIVEWLSHLANHPPLRRDTFLIGLGATASCQDRVSLTLNDMKKARLAADVENGRYDHRLPDLISMARGMHRLDKLEKIAREKVSSLRFVDEIEVYLAYQVKLREKLNLPLDTPDMRFFGVSWVTEDDLKKAETHIRASEKKEFVHYLSTDWQPWQSVLKRLHGEQYDKAQAKLIDAMGDDFSMRLNARLKETGLEEDDDARRTAGPHVQAEIAREIKGQLTREFLETRNLSHLLKE